MIAHTLLDDGGQGLAEYALLLGFIAGLCVVAVEFVGTRLVAQYESVSSVYP